MSSPRSGSRRRPGTPAPLVSLPQRRSRARPAQERNRTRQAILTAALNLYERDGYGAVTMRAIATQLGFSAPAIYNYFLSKEEIFVAIQEAGFQLLARAVIAPATVDALQDFRSIFLRYYDFAKAQPEYFTLLYVDPSAPRMDPEFEGLAAMTQETGRRVQRCVDEGIFPAGTAAAVSGILWGIVHGQAVLRQVHPTAPSADFDSMAIVGVDLAIAAIRAGLLPRPETTDR